MARKEIVTVTLSCDVCNKEAVDSYSFAYGPDNKPLLLEIDLCATHSKEFEKDMEAFAGWTGYARQTGGGGRRRGSAGRRPRAKGKGAPDAAVIREWAVANGYEVSERGRISAGLREAYASAK